MRCPSCKAGPGTLVTMELREPGQYVCPVCDATVSLTDAGYAPLVVPVIVDKQQFRVIDLLAHTPVVQRMRMVDERPCEWPACGMLFTPNTPHQKFHSVVCREASDKARKTASRPPQPCALASCGVEFTPGHRHQTYHTRECQNEAQRARARETWAAKQARERAAFTTEAIPQVATLTSEQATIALLMECARIGAPAGAGT